MGLLGDKFNQVYQDPMAQIGLGLLSSNNGRQGSMGRGLAQGMQNANTVQQQMMQAAQQKQRQEQLMQQRAAQMQAAQRKQQQQQEQQAWMQGNMPNLAGAPANVQNAAIEQRFRAPKAPTALEQKQALYQKDPELFSKMFPSDKKSGGFKQETKLRKEFQGLTSDYRAQQSAFGRVQASAKDPSPAGDLALIFNYMKILDPGSVVRESEFATAAATGSYGERIKAAVQKVTSGERLSPIMRNDFVGRAGALYKEATSGFSARQAQYRGLAGKYDFDPGNIVSSEPLYTDYQTQSPAQEDDGWTIEEDE